MASQELEVLQESSNVKNSKRGKTRSVLDHQLFHYVVVAYFTAATWNPCSCLTTSLFCLFTLINEFAYQICSQALLYSEEMNIPQILSHDSTWAFLKSSECSTCWVIVKWYMKCWSDIWNVITAMIIAHLMLSHCWGLLNTPLNNNSTNNRHVESLYSGEIQCMCTML